MENYKPILYTYMLVHACQCNFIISSMVLLIGIITKQT